MTLQPGGNRSDRGRASQQADLDRRNVKVGKHRIHLRSNKLRRHLMNAEDFNGVLRRERRHHTSAIDAERGEGLQICLDAGAAAGVRTGNGQRDRNTHHVSRFARTVSTIPLKLFAAAVGSGDRDSAEMTATPSAPAAITSPALPTWMPAMPQTGRSGARRRSTAMIRASPAGPIGAFFCCLEEVTYTPPLPT